MVDLSLLGGAAANTPESVKARIAAARLLQQGAAAASAPYTSGAVVGMKAIEGLMGGLQERQAMQDELRGRMSGNSQLVDLANALRSGAPTPAAVAAAGQSPATGIPTSAAAAGASSAPTSSPISTASQNAFIQSAMPHAQALSSQLHVDPRLIVAQAALESNFGKSAPGGNLFGIKATGGQASTAPIATKEAVNGTLTPTLATFAAYGSPEASFAGYGKLMSGNRYAGVRNGATLDDQLAALGKSGYATDPNYAAKVGAIAKSIPMAGTTAPAGGRTASADTPAPNAQPVSANTLPPGVTPDMLGAGAPASPYGAMPSSMAQSPAQPDAATLAAALRDPSAGSGPGATPLPATVQPSSPFGAMPDSMAQVPPPPPPAPMMADAPPVDTSSTPLTVQGASAPPSMSPVPTAQQPGGIGSPSPDPKMLASLLSQGTPIQGSGAMLPSDPPLPPPGVQSGAQPGNPFGALPQSMAQAPASVPPSVGASNPGAAANLSPNGAMMAAMGPNGLDPSVGAAMQSRLQANALPAHGLSGDLTPGFDNIAGDGSMQSTGIMRPTDPSVPGFTGTYNGGLQNQITGTLPGPDQPAGGPAFASNPTPAPAAATSGGGGLPIMARASSLPQTGPMPPLGGQSLAAAAPNPNVPAPNAVQAGPAPLTNPMARALAQQPMGLPGNGGGDPSSAQAFNASQASGNPSPAVMGAALRGQTAPAPQPAPQDSGNPLDAIGRLFGGGSPMGGMGQGGNPLAGLPIIGGLFGGGQDPSAVAASVQGRNAPNGAATSTAANGGNNVAAPGLLNGLFGGGQPNPFQGGSAGSAPASSPAFGGQGQAQFTPGGQGTPSGQQAPSAAQGGAPAGGMSQARAIAGAIMNNPYASPQAQEAASKVLFAMPQMEKMEDGTLVSYDPYTRQSTVIGRYGKSVDLAPGHALRDPYTGAPIGPTQAENPKFSINRDGIVLNDNTGEVKSGAGGYRFMTEQEKQQAGIPLDQPVQIGPNGQMHSATGQTINVGADQQSYGTAVAKTLADNHVALMQGVDANRTKLRDLNLMSGALQRLQQNGGTTGMGAEEIGHLQSAINTAANTLGLGQQFDVSDKEAIGKVARQISGAAAKDIGGARTTNFDMQQMLEANPGLALSPTGNQRMLGIAQQVTQRNIDVGQQMQDAVAIAVQQGRKPDPVAMEAIRQNYDQQHHIVDPITGQDLSASAKLPEFQSQGNAQAPATPSGAAQGPNQATPTSQPVQVQTPQQAMALPPGTVFMTPDGRRKVR